MFFQFFGPKLLKGLYFFDDWIQLREIKKPTCVSKLVDFKRTGRERESSMRPGSWRERRTFKFHFLARSIDEMSNRRR